ncbi:MAG TPA: pitrilysin family protein [Bacteroidia bacterium]|jgi:zinc protease|nr:pitrilysin family protein [Bacteroidia bacterium]
MNKTFSPDRKSAPAYGMPDQVLIPEAAISKLDNGIPVFKIDAGSQELARIEVIFPAAGATAQTVPMLASAVNDMLEEGTFNYTSSAFAEELDYYGAFLQTETTLDFSSVCLFTLNKHLPHTLALLQEVIQNVSFPEHEFQTFIRNRKQKFLTDEAKVGNVSRKKFVQILFGDEHPYGHYQSESDFDAVNRDLLIQFHAGTYSSNACHIVASGKMDPALDKLLAAHFGTAWKNSHVQPALVNARMHPVQGRFHFVEKKDAVQSAIRIGRVLFNKTHPDFLGMMVLNTVFGGYFGSRLMSNIREDKGYTYGIGSGMVSLKQAGYFFISTEVGVDVCKPALEEIYKELARLRTELIPAEELDLVRNYMLGTFIRSADGPFALADKFKGVYDYALDYSYYQTYVKTIRTITSVDLMALANTYLKEEDMVQLVVGKM